MGPQGLLQRKREECLSARKSGCAYGRGGTLCREQRYPVKGGGGAVRARKVGARSRGPALGKGLRAGVAECLARWGTLWGAGGVLTCMVTTPSSSAASLRIWLASTCASSRMEKSAWATAPSSQHATPQNSQRDGCSAPAPARPGKPRQPRARAAAPAGSSSSGSRAMLPPPTPRQRAPGAGKRGESHGRCAQGPLGAPRKTFFPGSRRLCARCGGFQT